MNPPKKRRESQREMIAPARETIPHYDAYDRAVDQLREELRESRLEIRRLEKKLEDNHREDSEYRLAEKTKSDTWKKAAALALALVTAIAAIVGIIDYLKNQ